jgi:sugar-specific transcriptional regulator TrmB
MDIENPLRRIGLTEGEIRVYAALLDTGETTTGSIVKDARVSNSKVYPILNRLIAMGLVSYVKKGRIKHFKTTSPQNILDMLENRKSSIEEQKQEIVRILPALLLRERKKRPRHESSVFEGYHAVKKYYKTLLKDLRKGDERLVFGARSGYPIAKGAQYFFKSYHKSWVRKGLRSRMIFNMDLRETGSVKFYENSPLTEVRFLPQLTLSSIGIQKHGIDMLIWTKETAILFVIESREIARTFREYFEVLWRSASVRKG